MVIKKLEVRQCDICGNQVSMLENGKGEMICDGKPMRKLVANTSDASAEKHVPVYEMLGNSDMLIRVGSTDHPMTPEHYIGWIAVVYQNTIIQEFLEPGGLPQITVKIDNGYTGYIYAWCNLHGLWVAEI